MDATGTRRGISTATSPTAGAASSAPSTPARTFTEHAVGLAPERGITSVTGGAPRTTTRGDTTPVQVLPGASTQEPGALTPPGGPSAAFAEVSDLAAAVQTASNEAAAQKAAAERANKAAAAFLKEAQESVGKAMAHAAKGRSAEADEAMAKAQEAWGKAAAQQALADQAVSGARAATARAQTALDGAQAALAGLATQGLSRNALMSPTTLVDQAARLTAGAGKAATAAEASANAVRTTLSGATDPGEVAGVVKLIAGAQAEIVGAQGESSAAAAAQRTSTGASKNANSKLAFVTNALDSGGTEAADPVVAQVSAFRDTAATGGAESRQHANEAQRLSASSATKAAAALAAAKELAARFAALGKSSPYLTSINKAAQQAVDAATKAQRSAAIAEKSATSAEDAARQADASLADAHGRVQKYLDDLEARNAPVYDSGGY